MEIAMDYRQTAFLFFLVLIFLTSKAQAQAAAHPVKIPLWGNAPQEWLLEGQAPPDITVRLYADAEMATPFYEERFSIEADAEGRFSVVLGSTTALTAEAIALAPSLEVGLGQNSEPDQVRVAVHSSFKAAFAEEARRCQMIGGKSGAQWQAENDALANEIQALDLRIAALEEKLAALSVVHQGALPTWRIAGVNVQLINGSGQTDVANGVGNLIVGYNEDPNMGLNDSGSHNVLVGMGHGHLSHSGLAVGSGHHLRAPGAAAVGGEGSEARGAYSALIGGADNTTYGDHAVVLGGSDQLVMGEKAVGLPDIP
jgi:hypothetical protein